eukprot:CAMPEP_0203771558 /NCGR_PEP_ID=MMETSP0099_2-20121227/3479_1 /ASSEMBLY_ACC=CAM_ASM_000209 /TAXON_ID=96639 /ORGANISM=" , Strain NY0313808BC1" /LENGTH=165 /DNA_ID=CAMNT_0050668911 /DNA_START=1832 /DNA_END=2329 /DNA_ORIENTATION=+
MSVEQFANIEYKKDSVVKAIQKLVERDCWEIVVDSRLWLHSTQESTLSRVLPEWGHTHGVPGSKGSDLIPELKGYPKMIFCEKKHYSCFVDSKLLELLAKHNVTHLTIAGINTDYCVFATALDAQARAKLDISIVEDAVSSISGKQGHDEGINRLRAHFGHNAVI